jgi:hypothetical protein
MSDGIYPSLGQARPVHCEICGGRVRQEICERHRRPDGAYIMLRDKFIPIRIARKVQP